MGSPVESFVKAMSNSTFLSEENVFSLVVEGYIQLALNEGCTMAMAGEEAKKLFNEGYIPGMLFVPNSYAKKILKNRDKYTEDELSYFIKHYTNEYEEFIEEGSNGEEAAITFLHLSNSGDILGACTVNITDKFFELIDEDED